VQRFIHGYPESMKLLQDCQSGWLPKGRYLLMATVKKAKSAAPAAKSAAKPAAAAAKPAAAAAKPAAAAAKPAAAAAKPAAAAAKPAAAAAKPLNKSQIAGALSEKTGLTKVQVNAVLASLDEVIKQQLGKKGPGAFVLPGLLKLQIRMRPSQPAKKGRNPATGEEITIAAKKASKRIAVRPLKALKDMVL
jgi:nucleoid DNA-binding protein